MDQTRGLDTAVDDLATARALIASLQDQLTKSQREVAALRHQLDVLCQRLFGKKSERVDPRQLQLALDQLANEPGPVTEPVEMDSGETPVRGHSRRRQFAGKRRHDLSGLRTRDPHQGDRTRWPARRQCKDGLIPRMHGLFVRAVLKRQRDSIRGLNARAIQRPIADKCGKECCKIRRGALLQTP